MANAAAQKPRNNAVEFWRIIFTLGVMYFHFNLFARLMSLGDYPINAIIKGGFVLGFFLFVTGYFMTASFERKYARGLIDSENAHKGAWGYFWSRYKGLMPALVLGTLLAFVLKNIAAQTPLSQIPVLLFRAGFEFLGIYQIGLIGYSDAASTMQLNEILAEEAPSGLFAGTADVGASPLWMGPGWYISAVIVSSVIIYYVLCKNRDFYIGFFCPAFIIGYYGYTGMMGLNGSVVRENLSWLGLPGNIARVIAGICVGSLMYYVIEWIKKEKIVEHHRTAWNIFAFVLTAFSLYTLWFGIEWTETQNNLVLIPMTAVILIGEDSISQFLSGPMAKFSAFVGKISLYIYVGHWGWLVFLPYCFPEMEYLPMAGLYLLCTLVSALVMMEIDTKLIKPYITMKPKKQLAQ